MSGLKVFDPGRERLIASEAHDMSHLHASKVML